MLGCLVILVNARARMASSLAPAYMPAPGLSAVWDDLAPLVACAMQSGQTELEVRFGLAGEHDAGFPNGVPESCFQRLCSVLQHSCSAGQLAPISGGWRTTRDLCYASQLRMTLDAQGGREVIHKRLLQRVDMSGHAAPGPAGALGSSPSCRMRFSWKAEEKVGEPSPAELGALEGVRQKERISFAYKMWRFDLSIVRGAPCNDERLIDAAIANAPPSYEVEMEFVPSACAIRDTPASYLAHSMLLKAQDICGILLHSPLDYASPSLLSGDTVGAGQGQQRSGQTVPGVVGRPELRLLSSTLVPAGPAVNSRPVGADGGLGSGAGARYGDTPPAAHYHTRGYHSRGDTPPAAHYHTRGYHSRGYAAAGDAPRGTGRGRGAWRDRGRRGGGGRGMPVWHRGDEGEIDDWGGQVGDVTGVEADLWKSAQMAAAETDLSNDPVLDRG